MAGIDMIESIGGKMKDPKKTFTTLAKNDNHISFPDLCDWAIKKNVKVQKDLLD